MTGLEIPAGVFVSDESKQLNEELLAILAIQEGSKKKTKKKNKKAGAAVATAAAEVEEDDE